MARGRGRFKRAWNDALRLCSDAGVGAMLGSEPALALQLGVSRTVVRSVLAGLEANGVVEWRGRLKRVARLPRRSDWFDEDELAVPSERLAGPFFEWILRSDVPANAGLNVSELARRFGSSPAAMQDFLQSVARFGLVERRGARGWVMRGFNRAYADELSDFRTLLELDAVRKLCALPADDPIWAKLKALEAEHHALGAEINSRFHDFSELDDRFHRAINGVVQNRFAEEAQRAISLIFHYHYQWNKRDERQRNAEAIGEHLAYIEALRSRDPERAVAAARRHLSTARATLLRSMPAA